MQEKPLNILTIHSGAPIVNHGIVLKKESGIALFSIDLKSKYCEVDFISSDEEGNCRLHISANDMSVNLNSSVGRNEPTSIEFPDFKGWSLFACNLSRYTLRVCLTRNKKKLSRIFRLKFRNCMIYKFLGEFISIIINIQ